MDAVGNGDSVVEQRNKKVAGSGDYPKAVVATMMVMMMIMASVEDDDDEDDLGRGRWCCVE